jgi:hypothetical protein
MLLTKNGLTKNAESNAIICEKLLTKSIIILTILNFETFTTIYLIYKISGIFIPRFI